MYFVSKSGDIFSPKNPELESLYKLLEKYSPVLAGSQVFEELIRTYEFIDFLLSEEEEDNESSTNS